MHVLVQAIILGVLTGGVYALMASGQTLIFGVMKVVNLAQGAFVILAAYLTYSLFTAFGIDPFLSILITTPAMFAVGVGVHWLVLRPLRHEDVSQLSLLYATTYRSVRPGYENISWTIAGYQFSAVRVAAFVLSMLMLAALYLVLERTRLGMAIRAVVQNPTSARLLGVESAKVAALGFGLGAATAAAAGSVYGLLYPFNSGSHYDLISRLLTIVVLGGLGSVGGAVVAAMIMGVASAVVAAVASPIWSDFTFFVVLLAVLLIRPRGIFGAQARGAL
jgi:branched-chain amino acid transport system permease protein